MISWAPKKLWLVGLIVAGFSTISSVGFLNAPVHADAVSGSGSSPGIAELTDRWLRYRAVAGCYASTDIGKMSIDKITAGTWFQKSDLDFNVATGYTTGGNDRKVSCGDGAFVTNSLQQIGFSSNIDSFCSMSTAVRDGSKDYQKCIDGPGDFDMDGSKTDQFDAFKDAKGAKVSDSPLFPYSINDAGTKKILYWVGRQTLIKACGGVKGEAYVDSMQGNVRDSKRKVVVNEVNMATGEVERFVYNLNKDEGDTIDDVWSETGGGSASGNINSKDMTCTELAQLTWENDDAFGTFVKAYNTANPDDVGTGTVEGGDPTGSTEPVCSAGALGWVICPLAQGMVEAIKGVAEMLEGLLVYQPLIGSSQGNAIKAIWNLILVIANVGLVIAILIIVFSQATSVGLSNYGIKKLLPRVFAAAILMNLSFYLCAIAVDLSNILGVSIKSIVEAGMGQLQTVNAGNEAVEYGAGIGQYFSVGVVGLIAAAIAFSTGAIWLLLPILVSALVAIITALLILAARQVLITLLIIIAPLAFLAWILPNTDEWFTKWRKLFTILLLLFPMIMTIFYGSILVSAVILSAGTDTGSGLNDFTIKLLAFLVLIVPLFSLPFIMKAAGGILDRFGVLVNNRNKGLVDRSRKYSEERKGRTSYQRGKGIRKTARQDFRNKRFAERLNLANKSLEDYKAENGGSLTPIQLAQWTRAQQTKGLAGGTGEIARMTGRGAMKGVAKLPDGPGGLTGAARDAALLGGAYAGSAAGKIPGGDMRRAQTEALNRGAQFAESKAFNERVTAIQTTYDNMGAAGADTRAYDASTGAGYLEGQYREAIATNNHEQAAAVINRLTGLGAGGRNRLSSVLQATPVTDTKMQDTIVKSVMQDNYGSLVGSRADTAKASGFSATGSWDTGGALGKVGTTQLATQDEKTLYQNFGDISVAEATKIMTEPNLESTVQNAKARAILDARRSGATSLPTSGLIDPSDPALGDWSDLVR